MAELRVSELPTAASLDDSDLLLLSQVDENSQTGYASAKTTNVALATKVAKQTNFSDLQTTSKNIIGAINEISGAASSLVDLDDVDITTPADGECLQYDGTSQKWENKDILAVNETTLTEPYVYKQVPNGKYTEKLKKIIGASVVWNQLVQDGNFPDTSKWESNRSSLSVSNNVLTATCSENGYVSIVQKLSYAFAEKQNKVLRIKLSAKFSALRGSFNISISSTSINQNQKSFPSTTLEANKWIDFEYIFIPTTANATCIRFGMNNMVVGDTIDVKNVQVTDITDMFGSTTIANYVNTLETAQAGSGITWLQKYGFFTKEYYAYSANTIQSVSVSGHKVVGKNKFNKDTVTLGKYLTNTGAEYNSANGSYSDYIPIVTNTPYYFSHIVGSGSFYSMCVYDDNKTFLENINIQGSTDSSNTVTFTQGAYIRVNVYQANLDTCQIELGTTATAYEPYRAETTALDHTTLRGLFYLDNGELKVDGDIYNADGSGSVKYTEYDLGDYTWVYDTDNSVFYTTGIKGNDYGAPFVSTMYLNEGSVSISAIPNMSGELRSNALYIKNTTYTDATAFKTAMSGVKLICGLSTPTTATLTPFNELSALEQGGTEENVDYGVQQGTRDVAIPCGNESVYGDNKLMGEIIKYINN